MRGSAWVPALAGVLVWGFAVALPGLALLAAPAAPSVDTATLVPARPWGTLWLETLGWSAGVALVAAVLGWIPGRALGRALAGRRFLGLALVLLLPVCLPAYVVFYTWWHLWPPDSALFAWAAAPRPQPVDPDEAVRVARNLLPLLRRATLLLGLACWSWPLVAWCVAGSAGHAAAARAELLSLDGAGAWTRFGDRLREDGRGLATGALIVFLAVLGNTTTFDLANVFTVGNELRARSGAAPAELLRVAWPSLVIVAVGVTAVWALLQPREAEASLSPPRPARGEQALAIAIWMLTLAVPVGHLLVRLARDVDLGLFARLYGRSVGVSVALAVLSGAFAALVAVGLAVLWLDERRWVRLAGHVQALGWAIAALLPATLVAAGLEQAYNIAVTPESNVFARLAVAVLPEGLDRLWSDVLYRNPVILVLGHLARYGIVAALLGRWIAARESVSARSLRRTDGVDRLPGLWRALRPRFVAGVVAVWAVTAVLALGEVPVTARVHPPGSDPLAVVLLNAMHYQRPETVVAAVAVLLAMSTVAALVALVLLRAVPARRVAALVLLGAGLGALAGCGRAEVARDAPASSSFGITGRSLGQFTYPRAIAIDGDRGALYIVDKTARVQRFDLDGAPRYEWRMPQFDNGKPVGISVAPDGRVFVADTHYFRVVAYDTDGDELMRFGAYGEGPGEFIYPTDVAFGADGRLYVAEYGGHDRVQIFSPEGRYLGEFGAFGAGPGEFDRPQALAFSPDGTELYIADACNHRIVVVDPEGRPIRTFGGAGDLPGELLYPYGLSVLDDGTLLVAEFGNHRVQRFTPDGRSLGQFGRRGAGSGELRYPWGVAGTGDRIFVLDSGNDRVQAFPLDRDS